MDDPPTCNYCNITFGSHETLKKHLAAIHKECAAEPAPSSGSKAAEPAPTPTSGNKRPRVEPSAEEGTRSENIELAPLLGVLSDEQKDALILRAVQANPDFFNEIEQQARSVLTEEAAEARVSSLDGEGVAAAVKWFVTIGAPANALTLLAAASERCLNALEALADGPTAADEAAGEEEGGGGEGGGGGGAREELLAAVEALPAAGALGALWVGLLGTRAVAALIGQASSEQAEAMKLLLEGLQAAATTVRASAPGVLIGPRVGETVDTLGTALERLEAAYARGADADHVAARKKGGAGDGGKAKAKAKA